ncbi:MAG TPA: hypothetical protein VK731_14610 [Candidatus Cybelea sp.]|nr:hypothetical protein [Candidatus Cybelea sp.]
MSSAELMETANSLTADQRIFLAAYLKHLGRRNDPAYRAELGRLNREIDDGKKITLKQAKRLHQQLKAQGL